VGETPIRNNPRNLAQTKLQSFNIVLSFLTYLEGETVKKKDEGHKK